MVASVLGFMIIAGIVYTARSRENNYNGEYTESDKLFLRMAILMADESVDHDNEPFAAIIVKDGEILATTTSTISQDNDPTAHAEINAIHQACKELGTCDLSGCVLYSSCEPCQMCMLACESANIERVFYGSSRSDASKFDPCHRNMPAIQLLRDEARHTFSYWEEKSNIKE